MKRILTYLSLAAMPLTAAAETDYSGWYQIEMLIFEQTTYDTSVRESYEHNSQPEAKAGAFELSTLFNRNETSYAPLLNTTESNIEGVANELLLEEAKRLAYSQAYSIVWHRSWKQFLTAPELSKPLSLHIKDSAERDQFIGDFTLYVKRYLHADLKLAQLSYHEQPLNTPRTLQYSFMNMTEFNEAESVSEVKLLEERRRMRSNELNYFDHPRLGILLKIKSLRGDSSLDSASDSASDEMGFEDEL